MNRKEEKYRHSKESEHWSELAHRQHHVWEIEMFWPFSASQFVGGKNEGGRGSWKKRQKPSNTKVKSEHWRHLEHQVTWGRSGITPRWTRDIEDTLSMRLHEAAGLGVLGGRRRQRRSVQYVRPDDVCQEIIPFKTLVCKSSSPLCAVLSAGGYGLPS